MRLLLFVDPTFRGDWAVALAQDLAAGLGGPLTLLTTTENLEADPGLLDRTAEKFAGIPGLEIEKKSRPGLARDAIIEETTDSHPAITIVPPAGRGKISRMIKGSRVKAVVHGAPATVMVARKPVSDHIRHVLVAVGGGPMSEPTVMSALEIAKALHASVTLLHVTSSVPIPYGEAPTPSSSVDFTRLMSLIAREGIEAQLKLREGFVVRAIW
jgi:nucleotide-binding universal stress UspA family protein